MTFAFAFNILLVDIKIGLKHLKREKTNRSQNKMSLRMIYRNTENLKTIR